MVPTETSLTPPDGAYDLSPVYFIQTNDPDVVFAVKIPFENDVGIYGDEVGIYHSATLSFPTSTRSSNALTANSSLATRRNDL